MSARRRPPGGVPSIVVEPCPANDLYLMLSLLLPTKPVARLVSDPRGFMHEHRAELGVLRDFVRGLEAAPPAAVPAPQPRQPPPAGGARRRAPARIARGESLLR